MNNKEKEDKFYCIFLIYPNGNGLTVYRRGEKEDIVAHIDPHRKVKVLKNKELRHCELQYLEDVALTDDRDTSISQKEKVFNKRPIKNVLLEHFKYHKAFTSAGYSGVLPNGNIVDRRIYPNAIVIQKNSLFGIPHPKINLK